MGKNVVVSVIMPAYNAQRFIEEAIRSVMGQTFADLELIVIDDGSADNTRAIVKRLAAEDDRIRFFENERNMGVAETRNRGFDLCRGEYVALLDSDDVWYADKLEKQLARMKAENADIAYCSYAITDAIGKSVKADYIVPERTDFEMMLRENMIGCSTVVVTRDIASRYRFKTEFYHEDYVLWLDLLRDGYRAAGCTETLVKWRYIERSRSFNKRKSAMNRFRIYRDHLKLPLLKCIGLFVSYAAAGLKKYFKSAK